MSLEELIKNHEDKQEIQEQLTRVKAMVETCIQCGTCSASCPNIEFMDITPRKMWRMLLMDRFEELLNSQTFYYCSTCYLCTLRCPRGLELTNTMSVLKQVGARLKLKHFRSSALFYEAFMKNVRQYGRVREMELMTRYLFALKSPVKSISYAPLGAKLFLKGKIKPELPSMGSGKLAVLFDQVLGHEPGQESDHELDHKPGQVSNQVAESIPVQAQEG